MTPLTHSALWDKFEKWHKTHNAHILLRQMHIAHRKYNWLTEWTTEKLANLISNTIVFFFLLIYSICIIIAIIEIKKINNKHIGREKNKIRKKVDVVRSCNQTQSGKLFHRWTFAFNGNCIIDEHSVLMATVIRFINKVMPMQLEN